MDDVAGIICQALDDGGGGVSGSAELPARGQAGFLIGRGGENIKRMEAESGASLNLDSDTQMAGMRKLCSSERHVILRVLDPRFSK